MSAELMKSNFVRRPSVCGTDYLWTSFKFDFLVALGHMPGGFFNLKRKHFWFFYEYFSFSLTWNPIEVKTFKTLLLQKHVAFESCQTFSWVVLTKVLFWIFEIWVYDFSGFFFSFSLTLDPMGAKTSKGYPSRISLLNRFNLFLNFRHRGEYTVYTGYF